MRTKTTFVLAAATAFSGSLWFATPAAEAQNLSDRINYVMNKRAQQQANNQSKARMLSALLYTDLTLEFNETPARDAIEYLRTVLGIEIIGRWMDDRAGFGLDPDAPISLRAEQQNALTLLEMVLTQASDFDEPAWQLREGFVEVGTKDRLAVRNAQELRYYPIRDLLFEPPMFDNAPSLDLDSALNQGQGGQQGGGGGGGGGIGGGGGGGGGGGFGGGGGGGSLFDDPGDGPERTGELERVQQIIDLIVDLVEPDGWDINGGDWASIRYYSGTLIVRAPDFVHRQIGGYPFATRPVQTAQRVASATERRYVTFTGGVSQVSNAGFKSSPSFGGAAGGGSSDGSRSAGSDAANERQQNTPPQRDTSDGKKDDKADSGSSGK